MGTSIPAGPGSYDPANVKPPGLYLHVTQLHAQIQLSVPLSPVDVRREHLILHDHTAQGAGRLSLLSLFPSSSARLEPAERRPQTPGLRSACCLQMTHALGPRLRSGERGAGGAGAAARAPGLGSSLVGAGREGAGGGGPKNPGSSSLLRRPPELELASASRFRLFWRRLKNKHKRGFPLWHSEVNPTSVPESGDSIPGLAPWVESPEFP